MTFTLTYDSLQTSIQNYAQTGTSGANTFPAFLTAIPQFIFNAEVRISRDLKSLEGKRVANSTFIKGQAVYAKPNRWRETISINYATASTNYPVTSRKNVSGTRTLTTSLAMQLSVGTNINVYNVGGAGYNGSFPLSAAAQLSVSYTSGSGSESVTVDTGGFLSLSPQNYTPIYPRTKEYCQTYWPDLTQTGNPLYYGDFDINNIIIVPVPLATLPWQFTYYETPAHLSDVVEENWITDNAPDMLLYAALVEAFTFLQRPDLASAWETKYQQTGQSRGVEAKSREVDANDNRDTGI